MTEASDLDDVWATGDIFDDEEVLHEHWTPEEVPERAAERDEMIRGLRRAFRGEAPKNMFLQGKTGQGKTATAQHVLEMFENRAKQEDLDVATVYVNCASHKSSYKVACDIVEQYTGENPHGHGQHKVFEMMFDVFESLGKIVVIVLDEIDAVGDKHDILYSIPRARKQGDVEDTKLGLIGITNDSTFLSNLDPKVKSSLYDAVIQFDAYNSAELNQILSRRAERAFVEGAVDDSALSLCAAFAAQDKGSARQAIDYLYEAGEVALDRGDDLIIDDHVREAEERVEKRYITQSINGLTIQDQATLTAMVSVAVDGDEPARTRRVYAEYSDVCTEIGTNKLAFDRMRDHLHELDMIGVVNGTKRTGDGQGGEKYYWDLSTDTGTTIEVLESISRLDDVMDLVVTSAERSGITDY
jgi:cell division control protein 6